MQKRERCVVDLLQQWGLWIASNRAINLGYKSAMLRALELGIKSSVRITPDITDEEAILIDRAVASLSTADFQAAEIIFDVSARDFSMRDIAGKHKISRIVAAERYQYGVGFIEGFIKITKAA